MTTLNGVETTGYRLHSGLLAHAPYRWILILGWAAGAAVIWWDAVTGPFTGWLFPAAGLLCLGTAGTLLWGYRHILVHFTTGLDERETELRSRVYRAALAITAVSALVVWGWIFMAARPGNGWHLKEVAYLLPLTVMLAPGAAAAFVLPRD